MSDIGGYGNDAPASRTGRPRVTFEKMIIDQLGPKQILHNGYRTRVVLRRDLISVGCTDVTPEALRYVLDEWEKKFGSANEEVVLQP